MKKYQWIIIIAAGLIMAGSFFLIRNKLNDVVPVSTAPDKNADKEIPEPQTKYGIPVDSFRIVFDTIKTGNTLSDLLVPYKVSPVLIDQIGKISCDTFRIDKIRAGRPYALFCRGDSLSGLQAHYMVYENNGIDYTVYDFTDTLMVTQGKKPVEYVENTACGIIESSLWMALKNQGTDPLLALEMSEIYSWTIDFFGIKKGDKFKIIYDVVTVEDKPLYIDGIKAGYMQHMGEDFWAIPFEREGKTDFYDLQGASLRKTFLKAPLKFNRISSRFTNSRMHPVLKYRRPHRAVDYSAPTGTPIRTIGDGVITLRKYGSGAGNYIKVKHNSVYTSVYMHMSRYGKFNVGDRVKQGDIIGYVGSTGLSTGPHLHFEIHENGSQINPLTLESPPADPVPDSLMDDFNQISKDWQKKLHAIPCPGENE